MSSATTTSTSVITGTGEKKCSPSTRSGRLTACASCAIGIDEVFDATIVSVGDRRSSIACITLELQPLVLGHGLDHEVGAGDRVELGRQLDPVARDGRVGGVELAAGDRSLERLSSR